MPPPPPVTQPSESDSESAKDVIKSPSDKKDSSSIESHPKNGSEDDTTINSNETENADEVSEAKENLENSVVKPDDHSDISSENEVENDLNEETTEKDEETRNEEPIDTKKSPEVENGINKDFVDHKKDKKPPGTIDTLQEDLKRELTIKRNDETKVKKVPDEAKPTQTRKKSTDSDQSCCTII